MDTAAPSRHAASAAERILATARELFYLQGIRATGVDLIIATAQVSKLTFYRHYPSKDALVLAFLDDRHTRWMAWFEATLARHGGGAQAIPAALSDWSNSADFRGCAFINSASELGASAEGVMDRVRDHKSAVVALIQARLPPSPERETQARALALALDGAIVQIQCGQARDAVLAGLRHVIDTLLSKTAATTAPP